MRDSLFYTGRYATKSVISMQLHSVVRRLHWRTMRTSRLAADESADNEPRDLEERVAENLLQD
jgi:hypothetical protein